MTVLAACQRALMALTGDELGTLFGTDDETAPRLRYLANDVAQEIAQRHDWQQLTDQEIYTGASGATMFPLPDDYDRLPFNAGMHSSKFLNSYFSPSRNLNEWLDNQRFPTHAGPGQWRILNGQVQIYPAMADGETATIYYQSKNIAVDPQGGLKAEFTANEDKFRLDERLLTLGIIWRFRSQERLEYAEDMRNFEMALEQRIAADRGARFTTGPRSGYIGADVTIAYPSPLGQ